MTAASVADAGAVAGADAAAVAVVFVEFGLAKVVGDVHAKMGMTDCMGFLDRLKELGFHHATEGGISIGIDDIIIPPEKKDIIEEAQAVVVGYDFRFGARRAGDSAALAELLGPVRFEPEIAERAGQPGVAVGLAWTPAGGDILFVESTRMPGKGELKLTGSLGDVMRESAEAARSWLRGCAGRRLPAPCAA